MLLYVIQTTWGGVIAGVYLTTVLVDVISPFIGNRSLPNAGGTVWDVVFPDAPGGQQVFEMNQALELYKASGGVHNNPACVANVSTDVSNYEF